MTRQLVVTVDKQHAAAGGHSEERDEADDGRNAHHATRHHKGEHAANEGKRQVEEHHHALLPRAKLEVEQQQDHDDAHHREAEEQTRSRCFALKLSAILYAVAVGQLHVCLYGLPHVVDHATQVASLGVGRDHELALRVLTADGVGAGRREDVGNIGETHLSAVGCVDEHVANVVDRVDVFIGHAHGEVEGLAAVLHLAHHLAT